MDKKLLLEKYVRVAIKKAIQEQEARQKKAEKAMYLIYRFPGLRKSIEELMSPSFGRFVIAVDLVAPKPTTFKVDLTNGQDFSIKYVGKGNFTVKVAGKQYNPLNIGELERASQGIADLLELNYAPKEGTEAGGTTPPPAESPAVSGAELGPDLAAAGPETTPPAETPAAPEEETPPSEA